MNFHNFVQLDTELFNNRKIKLLRKMPEGESLVLFWVHLLCLAERTQDDGRIYLTGLRPYTMNELASETEYPAEFAQKALDQFEEFEMIERSEEELNIKNWRFYQNISELD